MFKTILVLALMATLLAGGPARADTLDEPLDFHGFVFGTTLEGMRRRDYPDTAHAQGGRLVCTGDRQVQAIGGPLARHDDLIKAGVKVCAFAHPASGAGSGTSWNEALFQVGRHRLRAYFYFMPKASDPATSERLYFILVPIAPPLFDDMVAAVRGQYGPPTQEMAMPVPNAAGKTSDARYTLWMGAAATVAVNERIAGMDVGALVYNDRRLSEDAERLARKGTGAAGLPYPIGLRGFDLGMTLEAARKLGHPDRKDGKHSGTRFVCSGDPQADEAALDPQEVPGARTCRFFTTATGAGTGTGRMQPAPLKVENAASAAGAAGVEGQVSFYFTPPSADAAHSERLYQIYVSTASAAYPSLAAAYERRFGKPRPGSVATNIPGRTTKTLSWDGARSEIFMIEVARLPATGVESTLITYLDTTLDRIITDAKKSGAHK